MDSKYSSLPESTVFLRLVISRNHWSHELNDPRKRSGHESIPQIRVAMEKPWSYMEFPVLDKSEENLPMLFFQHLVVG